MYNSKLHFLLVVIIAILALAGCSEQRTETDEELRQWMANEVAKDEADYQQWLRQHRNCTVGKCNTFPTDERGCVAIADAAAEYTILK